MNNFVIRNLLEGMGDKDVPQCVLVFVKDKKGNAEGMRYAITGDALLERLQDLDRVTRAILQSKAEDREMNDLYFVCQWKGGRKSMACALNMKISAKGVKKAFKKNVEEKCIAEANEWKRKIGDDPDVSIPE